MATTSTIVYCSDSDLSQTYPGLSGFDLKQRLYGFTEDSYINDNQNPAVDVYVGHNSGTVSNLYRDSKDLQSGKQTIGTTSIGVLDGGEAIGNPDTLLSVTLDSASDIIDETYIKINDEVLYVYSIAGPNAVCIRGRLGTVPSAHAADDIVYQHFNPKTDGA